MFSPFIKTTQAALDNLRTLAKREALFVLHRFYNLIQFITLIYCVLVLFYLVELVCHCHIFGVLGQIVVHQLHNTENENVDTSNRAQNLVLACQNISLLLVIGHCRDLDA